MKAYNGNRNPLEIAYYRYTASPVGPLLLVADEAGLRQILFQPADPETGWSEGSPDPILRAIEQLESYFAGRLRHFSLPLAPHGTPFQLRVWRELQNIPYGETITYGELARRTGNPRATRAVGAANGSNPLPIVVPCHRVIGGNGKLTGYGGGLAIKMALLALEAGERSLWPGLALD